MDRFAARKATAAHLEERGDLVKVETYASTVGTSERTGAVVEPRLSLQWWIRMPELAKPALDAVMNDDIQLIPDVPEGISAGYWRPPGSMKRHTWPGPRSEETDMLRLAAALFVESEKSGDVLTVTVTTR